MSDHLELTLGQILGFARRGLLLACLVCAVLAAVFYQYQLRAESLYQAQVALATQRPQFDLRNLGLPQIDYSPLHVDAYRMVASSTPVLVAALNSVGLPSDAAAVDVLRKSRLQVQVVIDSQVINIAAIERSPETAAALANAIATQLQNWDASRVVDELRRVGQILSNRITVQQLFIQDLEAAQDSSSAAEVASARQQIAELREQFDRVTALSSNTQGMLQVLREATPPLESITRSPLIFAVFGVILGLLLTYGFLFLLELINGRFYTSDTLERRTGLRVLAELPRSRRSRSVPLEATVSLQVGLGRLPTQATPTTLLVLGVGNLDDSTAAAVAVAESFALRGARTLLVDADIRRPGVEHHYGVRAVSLLKALSTRSGAIRPLTVMVRSRAGLDLLTETKPAPEETVAMLQSLPARMKQWASEYQAVVIRVSSFPASKDVVFLSSYADGVVLAVDLVATGRPNVEAAVRQLRDASVPLVGAVSTGGRGPAGPKLDLRIGAPSETSSAKPSTTA